jgi:hypothetical protein
MGMKHWLSDTDKGTPMYSERNLFQHHFIYQKSPFGLVWDETWFSVVTYCQPTAYLMAWPPPLLVDKKQICI